MQQKKTHFEDKLWCLTREIMKYICKQLLNDRLLSGICQVIRHN
jgi:hypothetical protein